MHLTEIYDQYYQRVRKFILHTVRNEWVADDLVQETFIRINHNLNIVRDAARLQAWMFRIAHNICRDYFRQQGIARKTPPGWPGRNLPGSAGVSQGAHESDREGQGQMRPCVFGLVQPSPGVATPVSSFFRIYPSGFSQREIAEILGIPLKKL